MWTPSVLRGMRYSFLSKIYIKVCRIFPNQVQDIYDAGKSIGNNKQE